MGKPENPEAQAVNRPDQEGLRMKLPIKLLLLAWMGANALVFVAVSISPDWPLAAVLPEFLLRTRVWLLPLFVS